MMIREPKIDSARAKEVKVKIPVSYHIKLHSMKVLTGKQISDAITEALQVYFASAQFDETLSLSMGTAPPTLAVAGNVGTVTGDDETETTL